MVDVCEGDLFSFKMPAADGSTLKNLHRKTSIAVQPKKTCDWIPVINQTRNTALNSIALHGTAKRSWPKGVGGCGKWFAARRHSFEPLYMVFNYQGR